MKILYLFPDTNLFIQCSPLQELDWLRWAKFDEVHLIVCRPVQREIDNQKGRGNDRVGKRARKTHSLFRDIIASESGYKLIFKSNPQVRLLVEPSCLPSPELEDRLDYSEADDRIVGCVYAYREQNPGSDIYLLTHDSGPMATAKMICLPFVPIPDDWLLQPESNEAEKENKRLRTELEQLKKAEPQFAINFHNDDGNEIKLFEFEFSICERLPEPEISSMIDLLKKQFPLVTDFGSREPMERQSRKLLSVVLGVKEVFIPASNQEIDEYTKKEYPAWVEKCEHILRQLDSFLKKKSPPIIFSFSTVNEGTRPGKDALVTIKAEGNFQIRPPQEDEDSVKQSDSDENLSLPLPPKPPEGKWTTSLGQGRLYDPSALNRALSNLAKDATPFRSLSDYSFSPSLADLSDLRHDPNQFYYKRGRSIAPTKSFSLGCEQWRHGIEAEIFECELCFDKNSQEIKGALECRIHAENLSIPLKKTIPVRGKAVPVSVRDHAEALIKDLFNRGNK